MKYIRKHLDEEKFKKVFFEAWELENDDNLSLSLLDSIIQTTPDGDKVGLRDAILAIGKGISKSLTVGIGPLKFNMKEVLQAVEEANQKLDEVTFIKKIAEFKDKYKSLEAEILGDNNHKKLIVFVDDLDRCEPANVLNLLSVIKLFFTYGKRTVFVCGIDKEVVNKAVYHKYDNVVKSEEYLEKVFDISFDMPKSNISKMIEYYFKDDQDKKRIEEFLYVMEFTNPRHIKKLLNKYVLIKYYQAKGIDKRNLIPDQKIFFFKILTLFIIIIYEFDYKSFEFIRNYDEKLSYYANNINAQNLPEITTVEKALIKEIYNLTIKKMREQDVYTSDFVSSKEKSEMQDLRFLAAFITIFSPKTEKYLQLGASNHRNYCSQFAKDLNYLSLFCSYLYIKENIIPISDDNYILWNIFTMAELYL